MSKEYPDIVLAESSFCLILVLPFHLNPQDKFWTKSGADIFCPPPGNPAARQNSDKLWTWEL